MTNNPWSDAEIEILMTRATTFTNRGKRIKWDDFAHEAGHPASSCAQKYRTIQGLASGRLARAIIDADLGIKNPIPYRAFHPGPLR